MGDQHGGVHWATKGWILPTLHDPHGHEVPFDTVPIQSDLPTSGALVVDNLREAAQSWQP